MFFLANNEVLSAKAFNGSDTPIAVMTDTGEKRIGEKTSADAVVKFGCRPNGNGGLSIIDIGGGVNRSYLQEPMFSIDANGEIVFSARDASGVVTERKIPTVPVS